MKYLNVLYFLTKYYYNVIKCYNQKIINSVLCPIYCHFPFFFLARDDSYLFNPLSRHSPANNDCGPGFNKSSVCPDYALMLGWSCLHWEEEGWCRLQDYKVGFSNLVIGTAMKTQYSEKASTYKVLLFLLDKTIYLYRILYKLPQHSHLNLDLPMEQFNQRQFA